MATHLKLNLWDGYKEHPATTMKRLGITYQRATPQTIADSVWFWYCENIPDPLPEHLEILDADPKEWDVYECAPYLLTEEDVKRMEDNQKDPRLDNKDAFAIVIKW